MRCSASSVCSAASFRAPVRGLAVALERKLNREWRSPMDRALRGTTVALGLVLLAAATGWGLGLLAAEQPWGWLLEAFVLLLAVNQRGAPRRLRLAGRELARGQLGPARELMAGFVRRAPGRLDLHGVARAMIEGSARRFNTTIVAPAFWYLLFGLAGVLAYRAAEAVAEALAVPTPRNAAFGFSAGRLAGAMNLLPAMLAGLMLALATLFVPTARPLGALRALGREAFKHRSIAAGWPVAAVAGGLTLSLAGPRHYADGSIARSVDRHRHRAGDARATSTACSTCFWSPA